MALDERSPDIWKDPAYLADLNGGFIITERSNNDLLLTFDFGGGATSLIILDGFFSRHSGPGFGAATTPAGILDDEAAVPILSALFRGIAVPDPANCLDA